MNDKIKNFLKLIEINEDILGFNNENDNLYDVGYCKIREEILHTKYICKKENWRRSENIEQWIDCKLFVRKHFTEEFFKLISITYNKTILYKDFNESVDKKFFCNFIEKDDNFQVDFYKSEDYLVTQIIKFDL